MTTWGSAPSYGWWSHYVEERKEKVATVVGEQLAKNIALGQKGEAEQELSSPSPPTTTEVSSESSPINSERPANGAVPDSVGDESASSTASDLRS